MLDLGDDLQSCDLCGSREYLELLVSDGFGIVKCAHCGHLFTDHRPSDLELSERYASGQWRRESEVLDGWLPSDTGAWHTWAAHHRYIRCRAVFQAMPPPASVLEIGCGYGDLLATLAMHGYRVYGIDLDRGAASKAAALIGQERISVEPVEQFPGSDRFDVVLAFAVLEHVPSPSSFVRSVSRLLRPGGRLLLHVPNADYLLLRWRLLGKANWQIREGHIHHFTAGSLDRLLKGHDFKLSGQFWHDYPYIPASRGRAASGRASILSHVKHLLWWASGHQLNLSPSINVVAEKLA